MLFTLTLAKRSAIFIRTCREDRQRPAAEQERGRWHKKQIALIKTTH